MNVLKFFLYNLVIMTSIFFLPAVALADIVQPGGTPLPSTNIQIQFQNPLKSPDLDSLIRDVIAIITYILVPLMALAFMYVGFQYIKAQGKSNDINTAHKNLQYVLIGSAVILGAGTILAVIQNTVTAIKN